MDTNNTLKLLLDTLMSNNSLQSWSIWRDKSDMDATVVRIRFTGARDRVTGTDAVVQPVAYKRKSQAQVSRDYSRAQTH